MTADFPVKPADLFTDLHPHAFGPDGLPIDRLAAFVHVSADVSAWLAHKPGAARNMFSGIEVVTDVELPQGVCVWTNAAGVQLGGFHLALKPTKDQT